MPIISTIISRGLAIIDYFLAQWVDVGAPVANASPNTCWAFDVQNVTLNACGAEYFSGHVFAEMIELWAESTFIVMGGILAV